MRNLRVLLLGALAALGCGYAIAQTVIQNQISGNEVWRAAQGPGGSERFIGIDSVRGSEPITTVSGSGAATTTAVPGAVCWVGTAPTTWAVTLPAAPVNGAFVHLCTDTTLTTLVTVTAGSGDTLTTTFASQTLTANASFPGWQYLASTKIWYRTQ
jgi:hypothetical protein